MTDLSIAMSPVDEAKGWVNRLIKAAHNGPGDTVEAAIQRAAIKHGLDYDILWRLRYRTPKDLWTSVYKKIERAYQTECERQEARLAHQLEITKALPPTPARLALIAETEALLGPAARSQTSALAE